MPRIRPIVLLTVTLAVTLAGCAGQPTGQPPGEEPRAEGETDRAVTRLLVADGAQGRSTLLDLDTGATMATFEHAAPPALHTSPGGRFAFAVQGKADVVEIVDGGAWTRSHGDHSHHYALPPKKLDLALHGAKPSHLVEHGGRIAAFYDNDGRAEVFDAKSLPTGPLNPVAVSSTGPHHGVAVPFGANYLISLPAPNPEDLPNGVALKDPAGAVLAESRNCPELHGEAAMDETVLFACADGILTVTPGGVGAKFAKVGYPAGPLGPEGDRRTFSLLVDKSRRAVLGKLSTETGLVRLDLATSTMTEVPLPAGTSALDVAPAAGGAVLTVTEDGTLHKIDPTTGAVAAVVKLTEPFRAAGEFTVPRPKLEVSGKQVFVSDPARGTVTELSADSLAVTRTLKVDGAPTNMVLLGADNRQSQ
ncbi:YncE family protein [Pseudonocardia spinosispora]|uniref:YncE family protein n=1 Tax=Pseudonocardia spinosispora TaxID=103441 RepID=UPI000403D5D9|nr:hypothetical protein [Pseudonocardia spinosispora]